MNGKKWYLSKTFWLNIIAIIVMIVQHFFGFAISPEWQIMILGAINTVLRAITKEPIAWNDKAILDKKGVVGNRY